MLTCCSVISDVNVVLQHVLFIRLRSAAISFISPRRQTEQYVSTPSCAIYEPEDNWHLIIHSDTKLPRHIHQRKSGNGFWPQNEQRRWGNDKNHPTTLISSLISAFLSVPHRPASSYAALCTFEVSVMWPAIPAMSEWRSDTSLWCHTHTHTLTRWWSTRKHTRCGAAACVCDNPWCASLWQQADGSFLLISGQMCGHKQRDAHAASLLLEISNPKRDGSGEETIARQRKFKWIKTSRQTAQCTCRKKTAWRAHPTALKLINDSFPRKQSHAAEILIYVDFLSWTHLDLVTFSIYCPQETCLCISRPPLETDQWERWQEPDSESGLRLLFIYSRLVELLLRLPAPWLSPSALLCLTWALSFPSRPTLKLCFPSTVRPSDAVWQ